MGGRKRRVDEGSGGGDVTVSAFRCRGALSVPYELSFATVERCDTYYLMIEGAGRCGIGEITPLPGYGEETPETVEAALASIAAELEGGAPARRLVDSMIPSAPFVASALATALETWMEGIAAFTARLAATVPLAAICQGARPEFAAEAARRLVADGYRCLKIKIGRANVVTDLARIRAVAAQLPREGELRLDANQGLTADDARSLCRGIEAEALPLTLLEQPLAADDWDGHAALAKGTRVPLMLDESIRTDADIARAPTCGARFVKLKLCKHAGLAETARLARLAREAGLGLVLGNGVQTAVGNHLEARLQLELDLDTASEANGFLKLAEPLVRHRLSVSGGRLVDRGLVAPEEDLCRGALLWTERAASGVEHALPTRDAVGAG